MRVIVTIGCALLLGCTSQDASEGSVVLDGSVAETGSVTDSGGESLDDTAFSFDTDFLGDGSGPPDFGPVTDVGPLPDGGTTCGSCGGGCYFTTLQWCQEGSGSAKSTCESASPKGTWYPGACPGACPKSGAQGGCRRVSAAGCWVIFWHYDAATAAKDKSDCRKLCPAGHTCTWIAP